MEIKFVDYKEYLLDYFRIPYNIMRNLKLTTNELLKLEITKDGFDLNVLTKLMLERYSKKLSTKFKFDNKILYILCPEEDNSFKTDMIKFISNFPTYEIKFINNGHNFE